ncbi:MAG: hypothetical protein Q9219_005000 [cf. Caloplaca sp. 3 TL-2023]
MALLSAGFPPLSSEIVSLFYTKDPLLENLPVLVFYGPSTTGNATRSSTRIQAHVYTLAGFQSFSRLTIAPTSPLYAAVHNLPLEKQGDEICRGLAVAMLSYFAALSEPVKDSLQELAGRRRPNRMAPAMFDEMHAGELASNMVRIDDISGIIQQLSTALTQQSLSCIDVDVVVPPNTLQRAVTHEGSDLLPAFGDDGLPLYHFGQCQSIIDQLGNAAFLPTSKMQRAPSRPTAHSRSRILSKEQKITVRQAMCELLDTERSYVSKLQFLVSEVSSQFRQAFDADTQTRATRHGKSPVEQLFPESLPRILKVNGEFLTELEDVLAATEDEAIQDIEGRLQDLMKPPSNHISVASQKRDPTGTLAFAKTLLRWLSKFSGPYQDYMRASASLSDLLNAARGDGVSNLSTTLVEFGQQRLRSMLIEPVQRLPRYSLFVDNIIAQLPASHPAMSSVLKSKDVLTTICALESGSLADSTRTSNNLRKFIDQWPSWLSPRGRLITAVDAIEINPPYSDTSIGREVMLLLFPDTLIIVEKKNKDVLSAKGVLAEVDRSAMNAFHDNSNNPGLSFHAAFDLAKLQLSESTDSCRVRITHTVAGTSYSQAPPNNFNNALADVKVKVLLLQGPYDGQAHRLSEDVVKARIEGRFSEPVRDSDKWTLRMVDRHPGSLGLVAAIYEESAVNRIDAIKTPCRVQIHISSQEDPGILLSKDSLIGIAAILTPLETNQTRLDIQGSGGARYSETLATENLGRKLVEKVMHNLALQGQLQTKASALAHIAFIGEILRSISIPKTGEQIESRALKPLSPIKLVSNLFGGFSSQPDSPLKWRDQGLKIKDIPPIPPPKTLNRNTTSGLNTSLENGVTLTGAKQEGAPTPFEGLEQTCNAYVTALRSRSGNVVGRILRNRAAADELAVNELYNILLEEPSRIQSAAEVSVDVLFSAFEKFLAKAWQDRMGAVLPPDVLLSMTSGLDSGRPNEFAQQFRSCLGDMSPQNRRVFSAVIKLLSDLLEASGNDGDRGALMASFAEALVLDGNPHGSIMLFDRLVDDYESLFEDADPTHDELVPGSASASNSLNRNRTANTGSLSSNASSLRRRFGFGGLSRENSKSESESRVASVWRTLSKNAKSPGEGQQQPASLSKGSLIRSRSTDTDPKMLPQLRPSSRDRPAPPDVSASEGSNSRPTSSHLNLSVLTTIGENTPTKTPSVLKKKRRSSLSDLKPIHQLPTVSPWQPLQPRRLPQPVREPGTPPRAPDGSKIGARQPPSVDYSQRFQSPERLNSQRRGSPERRGLPLQKENSPLNAASPKKQVSPSTRRFDYKKPPASDKATGITIENLSPKKGSPSSSSGIPTQRTGLRERAWPPNATVNTISPTKIAQPQKLRMQSPQKLRERLSNEQKALSGAESSLRAEIAKIGEEMSAFQRAARPNNSNGSTLTPSSSSSEVSSLTSRLDSLSVTLASLTSDLQSQYSALKRDVESSLLVSERKARKLDELYKEANAENEALYERFNDELGTVLKGVRGGEGVEELRRKVKEGEEERGRLRRENGRLRREVVGLRSQFAGGGGGS